MWLFAMVVTAATWGSHPATAIVGAAYAGARGGGKESEVTKDEARLIALKQQVDSMQAELRANRHTQASGQIRARDAEVLIDNYIEQGMPPGRILRRVTELGAPHHWARQKIDRRLAEA